MSHRSFKSSRHSLANVSVRISTCLRSLALRSPYGRTRMRGGMCRTSSSCLAHACSRVVGLFVPSHPRTDPGSPVPLRPQLTQLTSSPGSGRSGRTQCQGRVNPKAETKMGANSFAASIGGTGAVQLSVHERSAALHAPRAIAARAQTEPRTPKEVL